MRRIISASVRYSLSFSRSRVSAFGIVIGRYVLGFREGATGHFAGAAG
jgi:hypothetical protein